MAKKKKTRQQKIIADLKRQVLQENLSSHNNQVEKLDAIKISPSKITPKKDIEIDAPQKKENVVNYAYLTHDLKKTAMLSSSIIALQIMLFLALTHKILVLPGLSY
jgi:hypothetical protein